MSRIVFVRHARPRIVEGVPSAEWELDAEGRRAAELLAERLRVYTFPEAVCSPEPKALATAQPIARKFGIPVVIDEGLSEHQRRTVDIVSREIAERRIAALFDNPGDVVFGEESADACFARFSCAIKSRLPSEKDLLFVTHGTVLTIFLSRVCGFEPMPFWHKLGLPSAVVLKGREVEVLNP
ncbi:MAG: histidine phosphatase family protein [Proteobacteria bacterium]|nr:histidine phosphatase family protein [Pseudomonadota bacterium]